MPDFLDDILKRFRPNGDPGSSEEDQEIPPDEVDEADPGEDLPPQEAEPDPEESPQEEIPGPSTELVRVPVRRTRRPRPGEVQGETPTENIQLSFEELVQEINLLKGQIRDKDGELQDREKSTADLEERFKELAKERKRYQEKTSHLELQLNSYMTKLEDSQEKTEKISKRLKAMEVEKKESDRLLSEARDALRSVSRSDRKDDDSTQELRKEKERFQRKSNQMEVQLNALISQMEENQQEVSVAREEIERLRKERDRLVARLGKAQDASPAAQDTPSPPRPKEEVHALEAKLSAILGGDASGGAGEEKEKETQGSGGVEDITSLIPRTADGFPALHGPGETDQTERLEKVSGRIQFHPGASRMGDPAVEKKILDENRPTLQMVLSGGGVSPLGLGALVADLDKALHQGRVSVFTPMNGREGEELRMLFFTTKLSMALAREMGYEPVDVRKVGICALLVLGNGEMAPTNVQEEFSKIIAVAGAYGGLIGGRPPALPGEAVVRIIGYVDEGKLDAEYVKSFVKLASLYPPGSWVQLTTGEIGIVVSTNPADAKRPVLRIHYGGSGQELGTPREVDLAELPQLAIHAPVPGPPPGAIPE